MNVECPLIIQAAIGGDLDIFKFLVDRGANLNAIGHICLSRKNKNSVISNVLGAACFYGRVNLVHFILEKYPKVDLNFKTSEKKGKTKQFSLNKEFSDYTLAHLSISSEISDDDSIIEILKLLKKYNAELTLQDFNKNNILHLASKYENIRVVKFIVEDLKLSLLVNEIDREGQSPISISSNQNIIDYLKSCTNSNQNKIEDELNDLIESVNKEKLKKKNKKKKGVEKDDVLLGSIGYQETLKIPKLIPVVEVKETVQSVPEKSSQSYREESTYEEEDYSDKNKSTKITDSTYKKPQNYDRKNYYTEKKDYKDYKDKNYNYNSNQGYERGYNTRDYNYNNYGNYYSEEGNYYKSEKSSYKKNYVKPKEELVDTNINNNISEKKETQEISTSLEKPVQVTSVQNTGNAIDTKQVKPVTGIIGLNVKSKKNKKENKKDQQQIASNNTGVELQVTTENIQGDENKKIDIQKEDIKIQSPTEESKSQTAALEKEKIEIINNENVHEDYEIDEDFIGDDEMLRATVPRDIVDEKESTPSQNENNLSQEVEKEISQSKYRKESQIESCEVKSNLERKESVSQHKPSHIPCQDANTREITVIL